MEQAAPLVAPIVKDLLADALAAVRVLETQADSLAEVDLDLMRELDGGSL